MILQKVRELSSEAFFGEDSVEKSLERGQGWQGTVFGCEDVYCSSADKRYVFGFVAISLRNHPKECLLVDPIQCFITRIVGTQVSSELENSRAEMKRFRMRNGHFFDSIHWIEYTFKLIISN